MNWKVFVCFFGTITIIQYGCCDKQYESGTVYMDKPRSATFKAGIMDKQNGAAYGYFNNSLLTTGWGILEVKAGYGTHPPQETDVMFAAGFLEGILTAEQIWDHYVNLKPVFLPNPDSPSGKQLEMKVRGFFQKQDKWTRNMITKYAQTDPYWAHMAYIISQMDGLFAGYSHVAQKSWENDLFVIQFLNSVGDLIDLMHAIEPRMRPNFSTMTQSQLMNYIGRHGHCSALVKVTGAYENLFVSHSSWFAYQSTNRIYKHYDFNMPDTYTAARQMSFSSYPAFLESLDDFYLLSSNMVLLQTTNNVFNTKLYDQVHPESLFAWQRVRLANMLAFNGSQWYETFKKYNSGTYNNQYMVVDLKQVQLGESIGDDALWVVEQIPGMVVGQDQTPILRTGYWPSYNVPFYESIYETSGYPEMVKQHGTDMSYQLAPRAKIFRRDQAKVMDMDSMKYIMRYNDYKSDPYSESNPWNTICSRGDLDPSNPRANGCYDTKVSDLKMALQRKAYIINGPTRSNSLPAFSWTGPFSNVSHLGLPNVYNFDWVTTQQML